MRAIFVLAILNIAVWGAFVAIAPGSHFALPGSYKFWWFDDVPWAVVIASVIVAILLTIPKFRGISGFKKVSVALLVGMLSGILPYVACSGGGI